MSKRSKDWNEGLAEDLRSPLVVQEFVQAALDEGISLQEVLGKIVRSYGVKEYAERAQMASSNLLRAVDPAHNPTQATLNKVLKPIGLKLAVTPIRKVAAA